MDPVAKAELTLISVKPRSMSSRKRTAAKVGPIQPSAGYRRRDGRRHGGLQFTGAALPALDATINDRTLIGDVALFEKDRSRRVQADGAVE
jgi:hypothetical protein